MEQFLEKQDNKKVEKKTRTKEEEKEKKEEAEEKEVPRLRQNDYTKRLNIYERIRIKSFSVHSTVSQ